MKTTENTTAGMRKRNAAAYNGGLVGSGYDCEARQFGDGEVVLNLMSPNGEYDVLYEIGVEDEEFDLEALVYDVASQGPGWFEIGGQCSRDDEGWRELVDRWNEWGDE